MANPRNLPPELLIAIVSFVAVDETDFDDEDNDEDHDEDLDEDQTIATLAALSVTNSFFNAVAEPHLYRIGSYRHPYLLCWATEVGHLNVMKKILAHYDSLLMVSTGIIRYSPRQEYNEWDSRTTSSKQRFWEMYRQTRAGPFQSPGDWYDESDSDASGFESDDSDADWDDEAVEAKKVGEYMAKWYGVVELTACEYLKYDLMQKNAVCWFPVHIAAKQGNLAALEILVEHRALLNVSSKGFCVHPHDPHDINIPYFPHQSTDQDPYDVFPAWTPYHVALCHGHVEVAKYILTKCPYIIERLIGPRGHNDILAPPFISAIRHGLPAVAEFCLEEGIDNPNTLYPELSSATLLWRALWETKNFCAALEILLRHGADLEHDIGDGHTLLMDACCRGRYHEALALLDAGASVRVVLEKPGMALAVELDETIVVDGSDMLGSGLLDICCTGRSILLANCPSPGVLVSLVARLYASEARYTSKRNPILTASQYHQVDVIQFLLSAGSDLHALDANGDGVLTYASRLPLGCNREYWSQELYQTLLVLIEKAKESGVLLQGSIRAAFSISHAHARKIGGKNTQVESRIRRAFVLFFKEGLVDLNARDASGETLLMKAVFVGDLSIASSLINLGAEAGGDPKTGRDDLLEMWDHAVELFSSSLPASRLLRKVDRHNRILTEPRFLVAVMLRRDESIEAETRPFLSLDKDWVNNPCPPSTHTAGKNTKIQLQLNGFPLWRLLHFAVNLGFYEITKMLLHAGASVHGFTENGETALSLITSKTWYGPKRLTELVVQHSADQDPEAPSRCYDMLKTAMKNSHETYVLAVLDICPIRDTKGAQSRLLLHSAVEHMGCESSDIISRLISSGASVNVCDGDGNTPLAYLLTKTLEHRHFYNRDRNRPSGHNVCEAVSTLIRAGAKPNFRNKYGQSVLDLLKEVKEGSDWYYGDDLCSMLQNTLLYDVMVYRQKLDEV